MKVISKSPLLSTAHCHALRDWLAATLGIAVTLGPGVPALAREIQRNSTSSLNAAANSAAAATKLVMQTSPIAQRAQNALAQTMKALQALQAAQAVANSKAFSGPNHLRGTLDVPNGLITASGTSTGGLVPDSGITNTTGAGSVQSYAVSPTWSGVGSLTQTTTTAGNIEVTVKQTAQDALLNWNSFNIGRNTILDFDLTAGGANINNWIAFNTINDSTNPAQILGAIRCGSFVKGVFTAGGQVYLMDRNGIIFGGSSQVNTHTLVASALAINSGLVSDGLLNNPNCEFLFDSLSTGAGNVIVQAGATLTSPTTADHVGGKIALIGADVTNAGEISTPDGQTILAAGLQVGFLAHDASDPSVRGLDVYIGRVGAAGTAINNGFIDAPRADVTIAGANVQQLGFINGSTSVSLNGDIRLLADYGAVVATDPSTNAFVFNPTASGLVTLGPNSVTQILPETSSAATAVGTQLALASQITIQAADIHLASNQSASETAKAYDGATILAPSGNVTLNAGGWESTNAANHAYGFENDKGQVYFDAGTTIDAAGSTDVQASVTQNLITVQLLGPQLANSPLQRNGPLRGQTVVVDIADTGIYDGQQWVGTPLADLWGYVNLIQRTAGELTTKGGNVTINAGGSVVMQHGSTIDVSGGWIDYQGAYVQTTEVISDGHIYNIARATPDLIYDGVFNGLTMADAKWGVTDTFTSPVLDGAYYDAGFIQGGNGGSLTIAAPAMALDGSLFGNAAMGPLQRQTPPTPGSLSLSFQMQTVNGASSPTPPDVSFQAAASQTLAGPFTLDASGNPLDLPQARQGLVVLSPGLLTKDGFGSLIVSDGDGNITVPSNVALAAPAFGSITLSAANLDIEGSVTALSGALNFTVYNYSPFAWLNYPTGNPPPEANPDRGQFRLGAGASLSTAGLTVNDEPTSTAADTLPLATNGGTIKISSYSANLAAGSTIDVSGGVAVSPAGKLTFGKGGTISISAGADPNSVATLGGKLTLDAALTGYSGSMGGSLSIKAPLIQVGGAAADANTLVLAPAFFSQGGFAKFSLTGIGEAIGNPTSDDVPGILIAPGTVIAPVAENWVETANSQSSQGVMLNPALLPEAERTPVSLSFAAPGVNYSGQLIIRGEFVMGSGAAITTDPLGRVSISGNTVTILGSIVVPGGTISIEGASDSNPIFSGGAAVSPLATAYLGTGAFLSTAGTTIFGILDKYGDPTGSVLPGGSITISGNIVAAAGSKLDVSGASGVLYLPQAVTTLGVLAAGSLFGTPVMSYRVDSNAGSITLSGQQELFTDATLIGTAGGSSAMGGSLTVSSGCYVNAGVAYNPLPTDPTLVVTQSGPTIPVAFSSTGPTAIGQPILATNGTVLSPNGEGHIAVDSFKAGGFDDITLAGTVQFSSGVAVSSGGTLAVANGGVIIADDAVNLSAPYVVLGLPFQPPLTSTSPAVSPFGASQGEIFNFNPTSGPGSLTVSANLIDVGNLSLQNISQANFVAVNGDIRGDGTLDVAGAISMTAGQIYPATGVIFTIAAFNHGSLTIGASGFRDLPLSAGGTLNIYGSIIDQNGVLRAPMGTINLGWDGAAGTAPTDLITNTPVDSTSELTLGPASITSVSAVNPLTGQGLIIPYGSNPTGSAWIDPAGTDITAGGAPEKTINVAGAQILDQAGSVVDLTGGGNLSAYRFVVGEGGSIDFLNSGVAWNHQSYFAGQVVSYNGSAWVALQQTSTQAPAINQDWSQIPTSYAAIPGYQAGFAPYAPFNFALGEPGYVSAGLQVGEQVYLGAGSGLQAGIYTLLPAQYALLPGAFLITPSSSTPGGTATLSDGSNLVSGYLFNGFSNPGGVAHPLVSSFKVESQSVVLARGQYDTFLAGSFLSQGAAKNHVAAPRLPIDAGQLVLQASSTLVLQGAVDAHAPVGGLAGLVDISSPSDICIASAGSGPAGTLTLDSSVLNAFGAGSLLIGGVRTFGANGTSVTVETDNIEVNDAGTPLTGPDVILVANDKLTLDPGSAIAAAGTFAGQPKTLIIQDATELKSVGDTLTVAQGGVPISFPQGTPGNDRLTASVGGIVTLANGETTSFSAGSPFTLGAGSSITLNAGGTISFKSGATGPIPLILGDGALLWVSSASTATIARSGAASSEAPDMIVGAGATISGASVTLDSTYATSLDPSARVSGKAITLGSGQISIELNNPGSLQSTKGLVLGGEALQSLQSAQSLSLLSYSSIDVYGAGAVGSDTFVNLSLHAAEIRGFNNGGGGATFTAKNILLDNSAGGTLPGAVVASAGILSFNAGTIELGANQIGIDQYARVELNSTGGVLAQGSGGLSTQGSLAIGAPLITGAAGSNEAISASGALAIQSLAGESATVAGGLGATLTLQGASVTDNSNIVAASGEITLRATSGDVVVGNLASSRLDAGGTAQRLIDLTKFTSGGSITLVSDAGNVTLDAESVVTVAAQAGGGNAGTLSVSAPLGTLTLAGTLLGQGGAKGENGTFSLDAGTIPGGSVASIDAILSAGGFTQSVAIRDRNDSAIIIDGVTTAHVFNLSADTGSITVTGTIDASGPTGGSIDLKAQGSVTLQSGALLTVAGRNFNAAGQGGSVSLDAGSYTGGSFTNMALGAGPQLNIEVGSTIDLSVAANTNPAATAANVALGDFSGTLHLRAPQALGNTDLQVAPINGTIKNASSIVVEGYQVCDAGADGSIDNQEVNVLANGNTFAGSAGAPATVTYTTMLNRIFSGAAASLAPVVVIEPGAEIVNASGNLTLSNDWNLQSYRFGPNSAPGVLTLRASGNLIFNGALSDGFTTSSPQDSSGSLWQATLMAQNSLLPVNAQDWSYNLTAGADLSGANGADVLSMSSLGGAGSLELGINDPHPFASNPGPNGTTASAVTGYYQVIRTGAGNITISTGANVELLNQFATIYTAGVQVQDASLGGSFSVPVLDESKNPSSLGPVQRSAAGYPAQYSEAGGNVAISALGNIEHLTQDLNGNLIMDSESELPNNWLYRRGAVAASGVFASNSSVKFGGAPSESTSWWIDFSNFFEGVGALGGGNVTMTAKADIANVDAVVPTNARMPGVGLSGNLAPNAASLVELGGGDLVVRAGHDINGGVYYVERGKGALIAGDQILTNSTRAPVGGLSAASGGISAPAQSWLPTTLFVGDGSFDIAAGGNVLLGPVANPFLLPEGLSNSIWYKTYFSTYATSDAIDITSLGGSITFREYAATGDAAGPLLQVWLENMDLMNGPITSRSYYQPWLRLNETSVDPFGTAVSLMPATLRATAFSGDINIAGSLLLSPSPDGTVDLAVRGSINGFQSEGATPVITSFESATIDLSDSDPTSIPGVTSPLGYQEVPGVGTSSSQAGTTGLTFLDGFDNLFDATVTGAAGVIQTEQALHASAILHKGDFNPVHLYAVTGDVTGLTLYAPKATRVIAGGNITDIAFYLQNDGANDISVVSAGGDLVPYAPTSTAREAAQSTPTNLLSASLSGDIQIAGPGTLEVLAGSNLNLGGPGPGGASNSTNDGIASIGNARNPALPFAGADIVAAAGVGSSAGLDQSRLDFTAFVNRFVESSSGARYLGELSDLTGAATTLDASLFSALPPAEQDLLALDLFYFVLRDAGRDHNDAGSSGFGNYSAGLSAIKTLFPEAGQAGNIDATARDIETQSGGNISLLAPDGQITVGLNSGAGDNVTNLGIVTQDGGNISVFAQGDVNAGTSRIFTLRGGNEIIWSSKGNIDAGASSKTVQSAPPTRVLVDPQSANVKTDLAGLATGGGIGVLAAVAGVAPGSVDLIAPAGFVNAGDAGIRATGNLNIAAFAVLNAGNITTGGASTGLPPPSATLNIAGLTAASNTGGASNNVAGDIAKQQAAGAANAAGEQNIPSIITVEVLGYGAGDEDDDASSSAPQKTL